MIFFKKKKPAAPTLLPTENVDVIGVYPAEEEDVFLVELLIRDTPANVDVSKIVLPDPSTAPGNWQCAFGEHYLNGDGTAATAVFPEKPPQTDGNTRLCFFMYLFDPSVSLSTQYGSVSLPEASEMPERLSKIVDFEDPE